MAEYENTYWNHKGKYEGAVEELNKLVPTEGSVEHPRKNRALEKFRKASNCYYDFYNNGLWNRANEFRQVFGLASSRYKMGCDRFAQALYDQLEVKMDEIIEKAAAEQNIELK